MASTLSVASLVLVAMASCSVYCQTAEPTEEIIIIDDTVDPETALPEVETETPTEVGTETTVEVETDPPQPTKIVIATEKPVTPEEPDPATQSPEPTTTQPPEPRTPKATTKPPTTPKATTELPTTPKVTTEPPTTLKVTTEPPTTLKATTEPPTTPEATTEPPTTPEVTTEPPTTPEATTEPPTTPEATTEPPKKRKVILIFVTENDDHLQSDYGAASLSAKATFDGENDGAFTIDNLNLHFSSIDKELLTNKYYQGSQSLGFSTNPGAVNVTSDCRGSEALLEGTAHSELYEQLDSYRYLYDSEGEDGYFGPNQPVETTASVSFTNEDEPTSILEKLHELSMEPPTNGSIHIKIHIKIVLWINPTPAQRRLGILPLRIVLWKFIWVKILILPCPPEVPLFPWWFTVQRRLCIQPVRIEYKVCEKYAFRGWWWRRRRVCVKFATKQSGAGLPFGKPGAITEWGKVDISFEFRDWKTVKNNAYAVVTRNEEARLRAEVNDADCIEVFFVPKFSPSNLHGGGATWGVGVAGSKVITSDEQVKCNPNKAGVDLTHLAHELGHVLGLRHPGAANGGSTGTLMCPSGWKNDNPKRNSEENGKNVVQPLLKWLIVPGHGGKPDCKKSADCGACVTGPKC